MGPDNVLALSVSVVTGVAIAAAMDAGYKEFGDGQAAIKMVEEVAEVKIRVILFGTLGKQFPDHDPVNGFKLEIAEDSTAGDLVSKKLFLHLVSVFYCVVCTAIGFILDTQNSSWF